MSSDSLSLLDDPSIILEGAIARIIYNNAENGYTVLATQIGEGKKSEIVKMTGHLAAPRAGCRMRFRGKYVVHPTYGRQFAFESAEEIMPASLEGIRLYLSSGLIKGIGPELANRIVEKYGLETLTILDENPDELATVKGVGKKNIEQIKASWLEHRSIRDLMLFLRPHGISEAHAVRIYRAYGEESIRVTSENPYRLAMEIRGFGFVTADSIASKLGFGEQHPLRIKAAVLYGLLKASEEGNVFLPQTSLIERLAKDMKILPDLVPDALSALAAEQRIVCEDLDNNEVAIYLKRFHHCESKTSYYLHRLLHSPRSTVFRDSDAAIAAAVSKLPIQLAPRQLKAIHSATKEKLLVITGGPGTGKTTIINAIIRVFESAKAKILLAAPTGRAAKRMSETSGKEAKTIHRLLEYSPMGDAFARNEDVPLTCDLLIIDEASMMDAQLFYHLLKAVPLGTTFILVGDSNQLPSVGPGNVLGDVIASGTAAVIELNEIFRQSQESRIICNAHLINRGRMPLLEYGDTQDSDFFFIHQDNPETAANLIVDLIKTRIPRKFRLNPLDDIQLLTPMHSGAVGSENMNSLLQGALNPNGFEIRRGEQSFRVGDKVMQIRNNYEKDIFNGDIGRILQINPAEKWLTVEFDGLIVPYEFDNLNELVPAYAISIHKSQGSEYPAVVIPLMRSHYRMLQRNLIYTAITRGKKLVVIVGERMALEIAVRNAKTGMRHTRLAHRLAEAAKI